MTSSHEGGIIIIIIIIRTTGLRDDEEDDNEGLRGYRFVTIVVPRQFEDSDKGCVGVREDRYDRSDSFFGR